jgi:16S rRNA (cytosine967-C5)-methyltransferase
MTPAARLAAAIDLLAALDASPRKPADAVAHDFFRARRYIGGGDRRAVSERAWGAVRQRLRLDWWLDRVGAAQAKGPTRRGGGPAEGPGTDPRARLLAAAQMVLAERTPLSAVGGAFNGDRYAPPPLTGEEQAVLRALSGQPGLVVPEMLEGVRLNLPGWALPGLRARFGDRLAEEAAAMEAEAPLDLRANLLRVPAREAAAAALAGEGIGTEPTPLSPWGLRIPARRPVTGTRAYLEGQVEVQDEGSQLIALLVDARPGLRVCDFCAGAGGKTLAMAAMMGNRGRITACDVSAPRLEGAARRLRRAGVDNADRHLLEPGDKWVKRRAGQFDRVLVDAPCTGTGTWRRNPDARVRTGARDLQELLARQHEILSTSADLVRPGGRLVYATCSLLPEEDEGQVNAFLARRPDFAPLPLAEAWAAAGLAGPPPCDGPFMLLSPGRHGTDGFFAALLVRRGAGGQAAA